MAKAPVDKAQIKAEIRELKKFRDEAHSGPEGRIRPRTCPVAQAETHPASFGQGSRLSRGRLLLSLALALLPAGTGCGSSPGSRGDLTEVPSPGGQTSELPNLVHGADGEVYLSWVERSDTAHALFLSRWDAIGKEWGEATPVASGSDWFVNWADFPSVAALSDGTLAAHWLAKVGEGTYAYGVFVSLSRDHGKTWSPPANPHDDGTETEHGFVTLVPADDDHFALVWLDGRETANEGAMTLRFATLDREGRLGDESLLDERVCDCCQTGGAVLAGGDMLFAYRDRGDDELRDISVVRREGSTWSPPAPLHRDGWVINGCPVNGPQLDAVAESVAVAWFTAPADDAGEVRVAFSSDAGRRFDSPIRVDDGKPLGRVDVEMLGGGVALVVWMEEMPQGLAEIRMRTLAPNGVRGKARTVASTSAERASGFPRMTERDGVIFLAWSEVEGGIRTVVWDPKGGS